MKLKKYAWRQDRGISFKVSKEAADQEVSYINAREKWLSEQLASMMSAVKGMETGRQTQGAEEMATAIKTEYADMTGWEILAERDGVAFLYAAKNHATRMAAEVDEGERNFAFMDHKITKFASKDAAIAALPKWMVA